MTGAEAAAAKEVRTSPEGHGGTYVYAVASGRGPSRFASSAVDGDGARIRSLGSGSLFAVVSDAAHAPVELTRETVRAHSDALQELLEKTAAVAPMRFGTIFPDDDAVRRDLLDAHAPRLQALLRRLENHVELRVKAFYAEEIVLREIVSQNRAIRELDRRTRALPQDAAYYERIRLGELVAAALAAKRAHDGAAIVARLARLADDHVVEDGGASEWSVATASFLVDRSRLDAFEDAMSGLADAGGGRIRVRCIGPLPAYSFVDVAFEPVAG